MVTNMTRNNLETRSISILENTGFISPLESREAVAKLSNEELQELCEKPKKKTIYRIHHMVLTNKMRFDSFNPIGKVVLRKKLINTCGYSMDEYKEIYAGMDKVDAWDFTAESGYDQKDAWEAIEALIPEIDFDINNLIYDMYTRFSKDALAWSYLGDNTLILKEATTLINYFTNLLNKKDISEMRDDLIEMFDCEGRYDYIEQVKNASDDEILKEYNLWFTDDRLS